MVVERLCTDRAFYKLRAIQKIIFTVCRAEKGTTGLVEDKNVMHLLNKSSP